MKKRYGEAVERAERIKTGGKDQEGRMKMVAVAVNLTWLLRVEKIVNCLKQLWKRALI